MNRGQQTENRGRRKRQKTDDTVLTVATAHALMEDLDYAAAYREFGRRYPAAGCGGTFVSWLMSDDAPPYHSWGNGSAMRVSPVGFAGNSLEAVLAEAAKSAAVTHNHPEGIKGAQALASAVFMGRCGRTKEEIRALISDRFGYDLTPTIDQIRPGRTQVAWCARRRRSPDSYCVKEHKPLILSVNL
ncbi:MAG: ADP-ribosylglycohydrolase family protein [Deltaproteobacteria bacterium]|nr:ADP-ribosylglycohydrolase family protein [Deltaproteobacteria bacterium]